MSALQSWALATISALAAIFGSLTRALGSSFSAWIGRRHQDRRDLLEKKISQREQLYSDFIGETARATLDAIQNNFQDPNKLISVYSILDRIRLSSSSTAVESAEIVVTTILKTYSNLTAQEIQSRAAKGDDPLRDFSNICRHELESLWNGFSPL